MECELYLNKKNCIYVQIYIPSEAIAFTDSQRTPRPQENELPKTIYKVPSSSIFLSTLTASAQQCGTSWNAKWGSSVPGCWSCLFPTLGAHLHFCLFFTMVSGTRRNQCALLAHPVLDLQCSRRMPFPCPPNPPPPWKASLCFKAQFKCDLLQDNVQEIISPSPTRLKHMWEPLLYVSPISVHSAAESSH